MSTPPRRRRRPGSSDSKAEGGGWLPTIAIGLGVIIAGLGIGALVAVLMQRNAGKLPPVAIVTSPPAHPMPPTRMPVPITIATLEPPHTPQLSPSPTLSPGAPPSVEPTVHPSHAPTPRAAGVPTAKPSREPTAKPTLEPAVRPSVEPPAREPLARSVRPVPSVAAVAAASSTPSAAQTGPSGAPAPQQSHLPAAGSPAPAQTQSSYDEHASAVVRRYLDALIRGDEKTARAALGANGGTLSEQSFLDPSARIVSMKVTRLDASNASVGCEIASAKGNYFATYHVTAGSSGPYISEHDYIKV